MEQQTNRDRAHQCMLNMKPQIIALKKEDKLAKPLIMLSGFILSLWSNVIFVVGCNPPSYDNCWTLLIMCGLATHVIVSFSASKGLYYGVNNNEPVFLKPWLILKIVEGIMLFTGSILCATSYYSRYIGLTPIGIILLMFGLYITLCVYTTYKQMMNPPVPPTCDEHVIPEHPPAYDSFTNQKNMA